MTLNVIGWCACARILNFPTANGCADATRRCRGPWEEREPLMRMCWHGRRGRGSKAGARQPRGRRDGRGVGVGDAQAGAVGAWLGAENSVLFQKPPTQVPARKTRTHESLSQSVWGEQTAWGGAPPTTCSGEGAVRSRRGGPAPWAASVWVPSAARCPDGPRVRQHGGFQVQDLKRVSF